MKENNFNDTFNKMDNEITNMFDELTQLEEKLDKCETEEEKEKIRKLINEKQDILYKKGLNMHNFIGDKLKEFEEKTKE